MLFVMAMAGLVLTAEGGHRQRGGILRADLHVREHADQAGLACTEEGDKGGRSDAYAGGDDDGSCVPFR